MSDDKVYDPMKGVISTGEGVPAGSGYTGKFLRVEFLPTKEPDPMTGKGGREWEAIRFSWEIADGEFAGKIVNTETPKATGVKSRFYQVLVWLLGKNLGQGEAYNLTPYVGKKYLLTMGSRAGKQWVEVVNAMLMPGQ